MSVSIRLSRSGVRNNPFYRIVATDRKKETGANALEVFGFWQPKKAVLTVDKKRISEWVNKGAMLTPAVKKLCGI